ALRASSTRRFLLLVLRQKSYGKIRKLFLNSSLYLLIEPNPLLFAHTLIREARTPLCHLVSEVSPEFKNIIVLGMNVLLWFNALISHSKGEITLVERQIKGLDRTSRFYRTDIFSRNILAGITEYEE
ncbi:MAG: hypothetical protein FWF79_00960, partial [Defluviitaleaceae bacterium]|nr:hypothetical protein [Defluviitaleaceae bacterium]